VTGNVSVTQGNGGAVAGSISGDVTAFSGVVVTGSFSVTQGNGDKDVTGIIGTNGFNSIGRDLSITQGNGNGDITDLEESIFNGNTSLQLGNGSGDTVDIESTIAGDFAGVTFVKKVSIGFGNGGGATLDIGTDGDPVTFDAKANFFAGGSGNTYNQGVFVVFQPGQPTRHNI
jgi:hypothetical protein